MMRLLRLSLSLVGSFALLITSTRLLGSLQPNPVAALFTNSDGSPCKMPCLFGANPDEMTVDQALGVLRAHPLLRNMRVRRLTLAADDTEFVVELQSKALVVAIENNVPYTGNQQTIHALVLRAAGHPSAPAANPELRHMLGAAVTGDVLSLLGSPESMGFYGRGKDTLAKVYMHLDYASQHMSFATAIRNDPNAQRYGYTPDDALFSIVVYRQDVSLGACRHWFGFISLENFYERVARSGQRC
jgi:hypothetical protein